MRRALGVLMLALFAGTCFSAEIKIPEDKDIKVYITPSGAKFHLKECHTTKENGSKETTLDVAKASKMEACAVCKPDAQVMVTATGAKYHLASCKTAGKDAVAMILAAARSKGLDACKLCNPPDGKAEKADKAEKAEK